MKMEFKIFIKESITCGTINRTPEVSFLSLVEACSEFQFELSHAISASMAQIKTSHSPPCLTGHSEESAFRLCSDRSRSQRRIAARRLRRVERGAAPRAVAGAGASHAGRPKPRQLDRAAAALARAAEDVDDSMHGALAGLAAVAVAGVLRYVTFSNERQAVT